MEFFHTGNVPAHLAKESFNANLFRIDPNGKAQLFGLSGLAKTKTINSIEHGWWTKRSKFPQVSVGSAGATAGETTIPITNIVTNTDDNLSFIVPNMILRSQKVTGTTVNIEHLYVTAVDRSASTITVERGFGGTTPHALVATDSLIAIGNAHGQGSEAPAPISVLPERYVNQTQIIRNSWGNSRTLASIGMKVGNSAPAENKADAMFFHGAAAEEALIFGRKGITTDSDGRPLTTMGGIEQIISDLAPQNLHVAESAGTNFEQLESYTDGLLDHRINGAARSEFNMYVGKNALRAINQIGKLEGTYQVVQSENSFGQRFATFQTTRGTFNLIEHPLFNTNPEWSKMAVIVDTSALDIMYLDKTFHQDIEQSGRDAAAGVFTTEMTLELTNPYACGIIYNITKGIAV